MSPVPAASLNFTPVKSESVTIAGKIIGRYFSVEFSTFNGIIPVTSGFFIAAYEDQQIPYYQPIDPVALDKVPCNTTNCSQAVEASITEVPYIVGIGSSNSVKTISATLNFMPGISVGVPFNSSLTVNAVAINSIIVSYTMPDGYRPADSGAWVGIWEGDGVGAGQPLGRAEVDSDQSSGTQAINGLKMLVGTTYTIGFASGPNLKDIISSVTFKTSP
ncbi:MAG: hypothetical protein PHR16_03610 [Methylovulum sp.]|nr:hypothetical protein [Methylovulum sp.]